MSKQTHLVVAVNWRQHCFTRIRSERGGRFPVEFAARRKVYYR